MITWLILKNKGAKKVKGKKFKCKIEIVSEYEIELDENYFDEEFMKHFRKYFGDFYDLEQHAEYIAERKAKGDVSVEGYGIPYVDGKPPFGKEKDKALNPAINIKIIKEDDVWSFTDEIEVDK